MTGLKRECEHGRYEAHDSKPLGLTTCPGGTLIPADTLVISRGNNRWLVPKDAERATRGAGRTLGYSKAIEENLHEFLQSFLDALAAAQRGDG